MTASDTTGHPWRLADEVVDELALTIEHLNANHADTVLLLVRHATGLDDATDAELRSIDPAGFEATVAIGAHQVIGRGRFTEPVTTADEARTHLFELLRRAREAAGDSVPPTSLERELATTGSLPTFIGAVESARSLTPNLREIVVGGDLSGFESHGGDQFVYVIVPRRGGPEIPDGYTMADARAAADADDAPLGAYYTVRRWDPHRERITLWAVVHGHDDGVGGWAAGCTPGDRLALWGPREGFRPTAGAARHLYVTDESGFAAVAALLEERPRHIPATVVAETIDADHRIDLVTDPGVEVVWVDRHDAARGTAGRLERVVRDLAVDPSTTVAFGAAESREISSIRKYLRHELGMAADRVSMTGYWRRR